MQSPREILSGIWTSAGGEPAALDALTLTGDEAQLPSSFRVAAAAQVSVAASGLAAAGIWKMRSRQAQGVTVDMRHAVVECRSERYLRVDGKPPPPAWDAIAGVYKTRDGFVRLFDALNDPTLYLDRMDDLFLRARLDFSRGANRHWRRHPWRGIKVKGLFLAQALGFLRDVSVTRARRVLFASLVYLPGVLALLVLNAAWMTYR